MPPVLILQHVQEDGPGYLATWLERHGVPFDVFNTAAGQDFPDRLHGHAALAILGGYISANDALPSLRRAEDLVRQAVRGGVPVIGHCLGGQLMARALGAIVGPSPAPEVGWHRMQVVDEPLAHDWFGPEASHLVMQWHAEAFTLPPGATRLAGSTACRNQAFGIGPHLALQFHLEVDAAKLRHWCSEVDPDAERPPTVQDTATILSGIDGCLVAQQRLADRVYAYWGRQAGIFHQPER